MTPVLTLSALSNLAYVNLVDGWKRAAPTVAEEATAFRGE
jgi:hypothetical protein